MVEQTVAAAIVEARGIVRDFKSAAGVVHALRGIDVSIQPGEYVVLRGRSGSGKTTLLNILVGLDDPTAGTIVVLGRALKNMNETERAHLRSHSIGMMFQNAHLFPSLTAQENVEIPLRLIRLDPAERAKRASEALARVNLAGRAHHRGLELSGGEQQRVALARALVHEPRFIVADEPTGNLDSMTGKDITILLRDITHQTRIGMLIATHDPAIMNMADRILQINDGLITEERR